MQADQVDRPKASTKVHVTIHDDGAVRSRNDVVVTEEPLEIRIRVGDESRTLAITMRTPGADFELAAGFLFSEGVVTEAAQIRGISYCRDDDLPAEQLYNIVIVELVSSSHDDLHTLDRHFHMSSACGVCGKATLDAIALRGVGPVAGGVAVTGATLTSLPERLESSQALFEKTGGLHAAALFTTEGELVAAREDVGRHNALDKLVGWGLLQKRLPFSDHVLMVSGRSSFEIAQKAVTAGIPIVCSVSAPSSLAVDVATRFDMTLVGFLRDGRFNVYAGSDRIS